MAAARAIGKALPRCRAVVGGKGKSRALSSGRGASDGFDFETLLSDVPPRQSKNAASSEAGGNPKVWESLMKEPAKATTSPQWDFLQELDAGQVKRSQTRSSFRRLADSGIDFLTEDYQRPSTPRKESASEQLELGEESLLHAASFKLIKDSFSKPTSATDKKVLGETLGMDSSVLFSSTGHWSKDVDSRTLAEVEGGNFYSTTDQSSLDFQTYTYEELGEKLRMARPPKEQILSSATGLSFGELRSRIQKIEQEEQAGPKQEFLDLKESLQQLKTFRKDTKGQLTYEELAFVNSHGLRQVSRARIEYTPPNDDLLTKYYSEAQLSSKERLKLEIKKLKEEFQSHEYDTGSPQVQIAIITARINNLNRHMREGPNYKRDKHSKKGLSDMVQYRKRLLRYLRRRDWPVYCNVLTKLKLDDVILEKRH